MSYWEERQAEMYEAGEMRVQEYFRKLEAAFNRAKDELHHVVNNFYGRYAGENGLSFAEAQKQLDKAEIGTLREFVNKALESVGEHSQEVENMSIKARITRYQALETQVDAVLQRLYTVDFQAQAEKTMAEVYQDSYYRTWYGVDRYRGFHSEFAQINPRTVQALLEYPFNGADFSSRLWKQKDHLQSQLMESLTAMLVQGKNPQTLVKDFSKKTQSKKYDAYRLLHTESSFLISEATHAGYEEDGVERYQILATLDSKTCGICGGFDGEVYDIEKAVVGVTMPPFHCLCRCTDVPYYDDMDLADTSRAARNPDGSPYTVPADMTYKEWLETYQDGGILSDTTDKWAKEAKEELLMDEKALSMRKKETAVVYGQDGQFLFQKRGSESEVSFTWAEFRKLKGSTISHNHPSGASLSRQDIVMLYDSKAAEIRVAAEEGVYYMRSPRVWSKEIDGKDKIIQALQEISVEVRRKYQKLYQAGEVSKKERHLKATHEINSVFAERYKLDYGKEEYETEPD